MRHPKYDAVIVGAGIGGLVCGSYLSKQGLKVLIAERQNKPGGCCTSFMKGRLSFDAAVHNFASCRPRGIMGSILGELGVNDLRFEQRKIVDLVFSSGMKLKFFRDKTRTIRQFSRAFPKEKANIQKYFDFIDSFDFTANYVWFYKTYVDRKFIDVLKSYFSDEKLIALLCVPVLNVNMPFSEMSALSGIMLYREYIMDGGYYLDGGTQRLADALAAVFRVQGGELLLSKKVDRILTQDKLAKAVTLSDGTVIEARYIVANCDATQVFSRLLDDSIFTSTYLKKMQALKPTMSLFSVYLGLKNQIRNEVKDAGTIWHFDKYDFNRSLISIYAGRKKYLSDGFAFCVAPKVSEVEAVEGTREKMYIFTSASYGDPAYWQNNKRRLTGQLIERVKKHYPGLIRDISFCATATPGDIEKFTSNYRGATCGWAYSSQQIQSQIVKRNCAIRNLFFCGHWVNQPYPGGVPGAAFSGKATADLIRNHLNMTASAEKKESFVNNG
ncbi:MAG: NAD(P)/FAD-dependent oxidoreductase [Candidatus Omnitrophica bacterium]|nr:NAD(P)/FAD-dependent oxidoreductase [Candidatus Omnitrophota bacterium]